ncbi:long-chain fatty acid [Diplodia corticola]|uniref:Long-chain fatty acid n=1 Tax=Diplodia corticola TaxID=236234 RepID=A0A1J9QXD8_9PEZI|nr:long-chain fatty acid [Diplodia corticola]OJD33694.1 long-chain fatty acid [Diplodia corticola]
MPLPLLAATAAAATAAATTAYLDARLGLGYDVALLRAYGQAGWAAMRAERRGTLSPWHELQTLARCPATADDVFLVVPEHRGENDHDANDEDKGDENKGGKNKDDSNITLHRHTYAQIHAAALRLAAHLRARRGVRARDVVAIDMGNGARFVVAWFAVWAAGAVPAFINTHLRGAALLHCLRVSTAGVVLVEGDVDGDGKGTGGKYAEGGEVAVALGRGWGTGEEEGGRVVVEVVEFGRGLDGVLEAEAGRKEGGGERGWGAGGGGGGGGGEGQKLHDMGILIYTSGTTGLPKPAVVSWAKMRAAATFVAKWLPLKKGDVLYTAMPLYHTSASLLALLSTLTAGTTLALAPRFSARRLIPDLHATRATHLQYVGETLRYLLSTPANPTLDATHRCHTVFGNGLRPDVWHRFTARFGVRTVAEFYAATEGPGGMWNKSRNAFSAGAVGRNGWLSDALVWGRFAACVAVDAGSGAARRDPVTGRCVRVRAGEPGELLYKLDPDDVCRRFQGYFNDERASSEKVLRDVFEEGDAWFATGDVLRRDEKRCWWFVDRLGDTFRWKSENVSTAEVAALLGDACHDVLREVVVYGVLVPGQDGRAGCAAVVLRGGEDGGCDDEETRLSRVAEAADKVLPKYAVPLFVRVTSALVVTGTNKPQKHLLQKDGIDPDVVEAKGDRMYWLRDGKYERLGKKEYERIQGGGVKL